MNKRNITIAKNEKFNIDQLEAKYGKQVRSYLLIYVKYFPARLSLPTDTLQFASNVYYPILGIPLKSTRPV